MTKESSFDALVARVIAAPGGYLSPLLLAAIMDVPMPHLAWSFVSSQEDDLWMEAGVSL